MDEIFDLASQETDTLHHALISGVQGELRRNAANPSGNCTSCGELIPQERRDAIPNICRCIKCQSEFDSEVPRVRYSLFETVEEKVEDEDE